VTNGGMTRNLTDGNANLDNGVCATPNDDHRSTLETVTRGTGDDMVQSYTDRTPEGGSPTDVDGVDSNDSDDEEATWTGWTKLTPVTTNDAAQTGNATVIKMPNLDENYDDTNVSTAPICAVQTIKTRQQSRLEATHREVTENEQRDDTADEDAEFHRLTKIKTSDDETPMLNQESSPDEDFRTAQQIDKSLLTYWNRAEAGSSQFVIVDGLLYKKLPNNDFADSDYTLVLPELYQDQVMRMGHDTEFSAHLGVKKSLARIQPVFWFPKMRQKLKGHIKCCAECQRVSPIRKAERQPLGKLDILETFPNDDITVDFLGTKLPKTKNGNQYIMVIIFNNSRFLQAIPMKNMTAENVANKLLESFANFSVPRVMRLDNSTGFRSELLTVLREKLGIATTFSVYHSQSKGGVERANQTILQTLKKFIHKYGTRWDSILPFLVSAIRNVPSETTGISSNQLVYGRRLRGLLILRVTFGLMGIKQANN